MAGYYFRLPAITQLTIAQQAALNETGQIALSGGPGTGKSVVSLWRHISNYERNKKGLLLTYTTTLTQYLRACCRLQNADAGKNVGSLYRNKPKEAWSEIIIDEAQDMSEDYYREIMQYGLISYGADDSQILYPGHCSTQVDLHRIFPNNVTHILDRNFRSTQSIMQFAKQAFPQANIPQNVITALSNNIGEKPVLLISDTFDKKRNAIERIINAFSSNDHNIAILVPWKDDVKSLRKNILENRNISHSFYYEDKDIFPTGCGDISNVHLTTFKSAKGLEFDTVIIPNFEDMNKIPKYVDERIEIDKEQLEKMKNDIDRLNQLGKDHDRIFFESLKSDDVYEVFYKKLMCSWEDIYVACTRARSNLYLISTTDFPNLNIVTEKEIL